MEIRHYMTFNTLVQTESFTKAALQLNYGQSTVTLHIKELEAHYKQSLFDRIGKKIVLTSFGEQLYEKSLLLVKNYEDVITFNTGYGAHPILRIGVYESLLHYRIHPLLQAFKQTYPDVLLLIQHGTCKDLRNKVRTGELDLAFQIDRPLTAPDLISKTLVEEFFSFIFPKGKGQALMEDPTQTVYVTEKECPYRQLFESYLNERGLVKYPSMETGSIEVIKKYVSCGLGYSFVPSAALRSPHDKETLNQLPYALPKPLYTQIIYHKDKRLTEAMLNFMTMVEADAKGWA